LIARTICPRTNGSHEHIESHLNGRLLVNSGYLINIEKVIAVRSIEQNDDSENERGEMNHKKVDKDLHLRKLRLAAGERQLPLEGFWRS
jgi:hypothetical protein